jgi:peptidoglycan/xylan/chitin deacetylase (PgdA/CDA1 family)
MKRPAHTIFQPVILLIAAGSFVMLCGCNSSAVATPAPSAIARPAETDHRSTEVKSQTTLNVASPMAVMHRPQVPILCYHQIRGWSPSDSKTAKDYIVPVEKFREQMKALAENGYHTILPDQLCDYLVNGTALPSRPFLLTYDDTRAEQFTIAREEMNKYGFKGVYFIMTVSLGRPGYMTREEVKQLSDEGNIIGSHTWNHSNVKNYTAKDWPMQIDKPSQQLENITGKPIEYFAYPFGLWNKPAIEQLKERHFKAAFQLSEKRDENDPLFTIRRIIVPGQWNTNTLEKWMANSF